MHTHPIAHAVTAVSAAGHASVDASRRRSTAVTLVLALLAYGLAVVIAALLAARFGLPTVPDHAGNWMEMPIGMP